MNSACVHWLYRIGARLAVMDISRVLSGKLQDIPRRTDHLEFSVRSIGKLEVARWSRDHRYELDVAMCDRVDDHNNRCFGAFDGERLVSYIWIATESIEAEYNYIRNPASGIALAFPESMAYGYKAFTLPEYRGKGILPGLVMDIAPLLERQGIELIFVTVEWTNRKSLRAFEKIGLTDLGSISRFGIPHFAWTNRSSRLGECRILVGDDVQFTRRCH